MIYFLKCEKPRCRYYARSMCASCNKLICASHAVEIAPDTWRCLECEGITDARPRQQMDLFKSVRPRGKRPALDGLNQQRGSP